MSSVSTITFDELRQRSTRALEKAHFTPGEQAEELKKRQRDRIETLLTDRAKIEDLASTQHQREAYEGGAEAWHHDFILLREIRSHPALKDEGEKLRRYIWSKVPPSRFKRFQELFSRPEQMFVPRFDVRPNGLLDFHGRDCNTNALRACLVSPDRLPDALAESLGLCDFSDANGDPCARLQKKRDAIPALKELWESLTMLQKRNQRLLVIPASGTILYIREQGNGTAPPRRLCAQHFTSIYDAYRKTRHEQRLYDEERLQLETMKGDVRTSNRRLGDWKAGMEKTLKEALQEEVRETVGAVVEALDRSVHPFKRDARERLKKAMTLRDRTGKQNVSVAMSQTVAAVDRLEGRFDDMIGKGGHNEQDRNVLAKQIEAHEYSMKRFRKTVSTGLNVLENDAVLFDTNVALSESQVDTNVTSLLNRMRLEPWQLERVSLEPFRTYAVAIRDAYEALAQAMYARDRATAIEQAITIHIIGKFHAVRTCFEHIKNFVIDAEAVPVERIRRFVADLRVIFDARQLLPTHTVTALEQPFHDMSRKLRAIEKAIANYAEQDIDIDQRTELYQKLKKYLETFDIEATVVDCIKNG